MSSGFPIPAASTWVNAARVISQAFRRVGVIANISVFRGFPILTVNQIAIVLDTEPRISDLAGGYAVSGIARGDAEIMTESGLAATVVNAESLADMKEDEYSRVLLGVVDMVTTRAKSEEEETLRFLGILD